MAYAICALVWSGPAIADSTESTQNETPGAEDDPTRPITTIDLRYRFEDSSTVKQNDKQQLIVRGNWRLDLAPGWRASLRLDLPLTASNAVTTADPGGDYEFGLGRPLFRAYLANILDDRWAYAFGSKIIAPAASGTQFGSGNWDVEPAAGFRAMLPEITKGSYFVGEVAYAQTFAQSFAGTPASNLQFSPELNIAFNEDWYVVLYPSTDIRINLGDKVSGQTGRLFLPLDAEIGRNIDKNILAALEVGAPIIDSYPVYRLKIEARVSYQY